MPRSTDFAHAIVRLPADSAVEGLRAVDTGAPDLGLMRAQHADYVAALEAAGVAVTVLPALPAYPDAQFVEDTALCLPEGAVILRPGAPSRLGEAAEMAPHLAAFYPDLARIEGEGAFVEGGDLMMAEGEVLAGLSARTNAAGVAELAGIVAAWGWKVRVLQTPAGVLHFKTDCSLLAPDAALCTPRLAASGAFDGWRVVLTAEGEEAAANAIRVNGRVIMPAGFARTAARVAAAGFEVVEVGNSECARLDGGMSCLSLRFTPPR